MVKPRWVLALGVLLSAQFCAQSLFAQSVTAAPQSTPSASASSSSPDLATRLRAYFADAKKQLGSMEPWQQKLFEEEALPEYQRYMRGYRLSGSPVPTITADIDFESLKQFLKFYAPKSLKRDKPPLLVFLKPQSDCPKCVAQLPAVKQLVTDRLERRGFKIVWPAASEIPDPNFTGPALEAAVSDLALKKKAVGSILVTWKNAINDDDSSHPDAHHYTIRTLLDIRDVSKTQSQLELTDSGSFERSEGKLLCDAFTQLGARIGDMEITNSEIKREEILVDVIGIKSFSNYQLVKAGLQSVVKTGSIEDQKISRGRAIFAVFSDGNINQLQQALNSTKIEGLKFGPAAIEGNEIRLELLAVEKIEPAQNTQSTQNKGDPET